MEISWRLVGDLLEIKRKASAFMFIHRELMFAVREHVFVRRELMFIVREYNFQSPQTPCTSSFHPKHKITPPLQVACRYKRGSCPRRSIVSYINRSLADTNGAPVLYSSVHTGAKIRTIIETCKHFGLFFKFFVHNRKLTLLSFLITKGRFPCYIARCNMGIVHSKLP